MRKQNFAKAFMFFVLSVFLLSSTGVNDVFARSGGGGSSSSGSKSFSPSRSPSTTPSYSKPATASPSPSGYSKPVAASSAAPNYTKPAVAAAPVAMNKTDKALYDKAKVSGTTFKSRDEAASAFKAKHAQEYNNKFTKEPTTRPNYVPSSYTSGGVNYTVVYNQGYGGYGYYGPGGAWIMYDAMRDAVMLSILMERHSYYGPQAGDYGPQPVVTVGHGPLYYFGMVLLFAFLVGGVVFVVKKLL